METIVIRKRNHSFGISVRPLFQSVKMTITEPIKITDEEKDREKQKAKEQQTLSQWWISLLVVIAIIIILIAVILIARFARILKMK